MGQISLRCSNDLVASHEEAAVTNHANHRSVREPQLARYRGRHSITHCAGQGGHQTLRIDERKMPIDRCGKCTGIKTHHSVRRCDSSHLLHNLDKRHTITQLGLRPCRDALINLAQFRGESHAPARRLPADYPCEFSGEQLGIADGTHIRSEVQSDNVVVRKNVNKRLIRPRQLRVGW